MSGSGGPLGIGIRSGSYGSLDKQLQNGASPIQSNRKPSKMLKEKEKERLFLWICKFAGRKKVGMLFLCLISAAVFVWVLYVGKGSSIPSPFLVFDYCFYFQAYLSLRLLQFEFSVSGLFRFVF